MLITVPISSTIPVNIANAVFFPRIAVAAVAIVAALLNLNDGDDDDDDDSGYRINDGVNAEIDVDAKEVADITKDAATITAIADLAVRVIIVVVL